MSGPNYASVLRDHEPITLIDAGDLDGCTCDGWEGTNWDEYRAHVAKSLTKITEAWLRSVDPVEVALAGVDHLLFQLDPWRTR